MPPIGLPRATFAETAGVVADVVAPLFARGIIVRRPRVVGALDRLDADRRAVRRLQRLRERHGDGPVLLRIPVRDVAVVLGHDDVRRVLDGSPDPFAPDSREKRAALGHFQPHGVLISHGADRADRRRFNEAVLDSSQPVHALGEQLAAKVREEAAPLRARPGLTWDAYVQAWMRLVRRVVLGDAAREDHELTDMLAALRRDANWAFLKPRRTRLRRRFFARLQAHLDRAEPGSLAARIAETPASDRTRPLEQVPQWLFAFDAAGMAAFRALALLAAHPQGAARDDPQTLRAAVLESIRLWPTTPAVLRDTTTDVAWPGGTLPAGAGVVIFAPYFHRDGERLPFADRFAPEHWLDGSAPDWPLIPFSAGPAECPGRNLVLFLTSTLLGELLAGHDVRQSGGTSLDPSAPLPATFSPFRLAFDLVPAGEPAWAT